ncbi:DNA polymerase III subunit chi [Actimicrobium sp. CCC2.4]|uniref:DNA polymerase III subunit chi n=1 Tax=Actimicrobium sp. CCC2.4 TaxID=3048606 RepID=UPI002AC99923|nr:DNA polymerase III subunit chi [Actimicrobium sp. CCC2.4]MEB0135825.1 DNA polymerase III subunit chi [Actimicrobium sp. CCC2.4]WPX33304.1 DNA polymerase III subunit chi [Actimicrobium sp. CCC2.4]
MTRVDFHSNIPDKISYVCRLVRKARHAHSRIVLMGEPQQLAALDAALWTFSEHDFVPHVMAGDALAIDTPVILATTDADADALPHHQVLINLTSQPPPTFARFERLFEIVATDAADIASGRDRYRFYQQRGYALTHFIADK